MSGYRITEDHCGQNTTKSAALFERAQKRIPGGVNSPVRAFLSVGGTPRFIDKAEGCRLIDADGNEYIDYVGSWGPALLGHAPGIVTDAVREAALCGLSFGAPAEAEIELAELICALVPSVEMVRMVNSGTEAVMSALRVARGFTKRDEIVKFAGCYHGHADAMLVAAGSGALTQGVPNSAGVTQEVAKHTRILPYNDAEAVRALFARHGESIAAVIVEPVAANMGVVLPEPDFLQTLREVASRSGALLIFDEVITGFRISGGGAQGYYGVLPDLTVFGKIIGGGLPVGAYGGRADIMRMVAPLGPVYQAGTLSGNPIAMAAGLATLRHIQQNRVLYRTLQERTARLANGLKSAADRAGVSVQTPHVTGLAGLFFAAGRVRNYDDVQRADAKQYADFFHGMLKRGVYFAPSAFEAAFLSAAHGDEDIAYTLGAAEEVLAQMAGRV